jgi:hypothetical protein
MKRLVASSVLMVVLTGCATAPPRPNVYASPTRGQSYERVAQDTTTCESWAQQQTGYDPVAETAKGAVVGTLLGGALGAGGGAALGAASGGSAGRGAATGAVVGGLVGGVAGGAYQYSKSKEGYDRAYAACMSGRGYSTGPSMAAAPAPPAPVAVAPPPPVVVAAPPPVIVVQQPPTVVVATPPPVVVVEPRRVHVPPGHYPAPGYCRVWHPGWPPGQQPKPFPCHKPVAIPAGAFILYNGVAWDGDYDWRAHSKRQPGSVPSVIVEMSVRH